MDNSCKTLVDNYVNWLKERISIKTIKGICEITTPFLDRHNDLIQIYLKKTDNGFILTDDGYTISDLKQSGCDFTTEKRRHSLSIILNSYGVRQSGEELIIETKPENFPQKKHNFIQALLAVNDLFVLAAPIVASVFKEDVERYLRLKEIRFTPSVTFVGKSGFNHYFDFVIPSSKIKPERILKMINKPTKQSIVPLIFSWTDTKEVRENNSELFAVLNDVEKNVGKDQIDDQYGIKDFLWSNKEEYIEDLIN